MEGLLRLRSLGGFRFGELRASGPLLASQGFIRV